MEKVITVRTEFDNHNTEISIDNSMDFKELSIKQTRNTNTKNTFTETLNLQLHKGFKGTTALEINKISLIGREVELLKEFLNQY